ncbi:MAG: NUDIX domain-containing protein [Gemmatimonadota bacterium]
MRREPEVVIPFDRLPPGFAERVASSPADAAPPKPAATTVLVRDADTGPELLLLERHRSAAFVPGAYVFPGGRVDSADDDPALHQRLGVLPRGPAPAYWSAALRELFEETGVLLARRADGSPCAAAATDARVAEWRHALLAESATLLDVLGALDVQPDLSRMVYCAHWVTPLAEPKRYDTRFFLCELPPGCEARIDEREMTDMQWLTPDAALAAFAAGALQMVFPTVKTIERLAHYGSVDAMLDAFRSADIPAVLPRLVRTESGIGIVVENYEQTEQDEHDEGTHTG